VSVTKALQTSEARFRSALAALNEGFLIFDADGSIIECNDEFVRITGYPREMMVGATAGEVSRRIARLGIAHPVQADGTPLRQHEDPVAVTMLTGRACSEAVYGIHRPSGERRWISTNTAPFELPGSDRPGVVATMADITERRRAEDKVRLLTSVVADSPTIVLITDAADRIEYVNDAFSVRTGWTLEEVCGRTPEFMLSDLTLPETWAELMSALGSGGAWRGEVHNTTRSGETWLASSQVYVLRGADGRVTHHVALLQDITGQRHREDELTRVREAALSAARAKNEFLQNMSHELRTPLNGILGMSELLLQTSLDVEQRADLVQLRRSGEDLLTVINHLFDFARIESGGAARESVPFRLGGCIREVQAALASAAEARGLTWAVHVDDELPDTRVGDVGALRRVLLCLVSNAVKFTEQGEVTLSVRTHDATGSGANVWFEMRDTGIGIAAERQAQIFEAFEQVDGSTTRKYGGVGLGLALATRLVRHMGGVLEVESVPGRCSSFSFAVPLEVAAEGLEGPGVAAAVSPIVPALAGSRVLLVVARMPARAATLAALERAGATVDVTRVADGPEAAARLLAEAHASPYRAIVLDERDGGHHAFDFALRLRRALGGVLPAALLFTSAGERGDAARCRELGITGYLASPAGDDDLVEALRHVRPATTAPAPLVTRHLLREGFAKRRVLLVEDNPVNRKVASRMLDRSGYDVTVAVEGAEAIDRFREASWDIVLMDVQMPGMDGLEATRRIRELERAGGLHRTPILAVTAHTLDSDRSAVLEAGMDDLVPKPIQADHLFATMQRYLADAPAAPFAATAPLALEDVIDWQDALERMDGDAAIMEQILRIFLEDCPNIMQRLEEARASGDAVQLERAAHGLKGASGTISARHVEPLAREVERLARTGRLSEAHDRFEDLRREMLRLMKVLENLPPPQQQQDAA
jgi:PAS domain S-box-containing protein